MQSHHFMANRWGTNGNSDFFIVSPSIYQRVMGLDVMILVFWMLSFRPTFSLSSFTFFKRLFSSFSLSAIRVVASTYLRLLLFLLAILIPACASSNPAFSVMYSVYKVNKESDNIQPWHTPFPICNQSVVPNCGKFWKRWNTRPPDLPLEKPVCRSGSNS